MPPTTTDCAAGKPDRRYPHTTARADARLHITTVPPTKATRIVWI